MITAEDEAAGADLYQEWIAEDEANANDFIADHCSGGTLRIAS